MDRWNLLLNPAPHYRLSVESGNGPNYLALDRLTVDDLSVRSGNGATTLIVPRTGPFHGNVETGNGSVDIVLPTDRPVRLHIRRGNGSLDTGPLTATERSSSHEGTYTTPDWATSSETNRIDIDLSIGNGGVRIKR
ncbi:MAG: hypothetical protein NVS2B7_25700 [Herpetosiphon sp.]